MKHLAIAKIDPQTTPQKMQPHLVEEAKVAWRLYRDGILREMYDRPDRKGVVFLLECASAEAARKALSELPFVREKLIDFELIQIEPFPYFETLFKDYQPSHV